MLKASRTNRLDIDMLDNSANDVENSSSDIDLQKASFCEQLKQREQQWWEARQSLIALEERWMFWFGDNSLIMWLLWQLVSYFVVAIVLMLLSSLLNVELYLWMYMAVFGVQTLLFVVMLSSKGRLANRLQNNIDSADLVREQALNEMYILASDIILPAIHASAPISLQTIYERYKSHLKLASLQRLLQKEVEAGRLILGEYQIEAEILPPEIADEELSPYADKMIYKSLIAIS
ncbi:MULTISPECIES: hypothetical protein [unclassified Psychrobacter]|uniref:hypothetical protein n=1 Tax=unclassified Psychrobacter TaxID=196806 RepID=UPI00071E9A85|nr:MULTISPECIES: hypothetical protein [unclassified Psychrobacter]OLF35949.1 hypothetical protein BTV98_12390 [Psychrobacter sp. Cmf 22.2]